MGRAAFHRLELPVRHGDAVKTKGLILPSVAFQLESCIKHIFYQEMAASRVQFAISDGNSCCNFLVHKMGCKFNVNSGLRVRLLL